MKTIDALNNVIKMDDSDDDDIFILATESSLPKRSLIDMLKLKLLLVAFAIKLVRRRILS